MLPDLQTTHQTRARPAEEWSKRMSVTSTMRCGLLFRWQSFWLGVHYSPANRRFCINVVPCVTFWITLAGGFCPDMTKKGQR